MMNNRLIAVHVEVSCPPYLPNFATSQLSSVEDEVGIGEKSDQTMERSLQELRIEQKAPTILKGEPRANYTRDDNSVVVVYKVVSQPKCNYP